MKSLVSAANSLGIDLGPAQQQLFRRYFELIEDGSERANLTGARGWQRIRDELFTRSLRIAAPAGGDVPTTGWWEGRRVLDVGSGAGIPGLVLELALPDIKLTLLDATRKKTDFLNRVVSELELEDVLVINGRAEELAHDPAHREAYDVVVARAVADLSELAELTLPFAQLGGTVIAPKGADAEAEVREADWAATQLGAAPAITQIVALPGSAPPDLMVYWFKIRQTDEQYPRRVGVPHQRPLRRPERAGAQ